MSTILYFAYGSNMSTPRLRYRVPGCRFAFVARLPNYKLCFHKRSKDGSAKCNAFRTAEPTDVVIGAVYEIPTNEKPVVRTSPMQASLTIASNPIRGTRTLFWQAPLSIRYLRNM
jgi:hypothetical protein